LGDLHLRASGNYRREAVLSNKKASFFDKKPRLIAQSGL
jgi:hypothetical protein